MGTTKEIKMKFRVTYIAEIDDQYLLDNDIDLTDRDAIEVFF